MKKLYLLCGAYDEGVESVYPFWADSDHEDEIAQFILDNAPKFESVLRHMGHPQTAEEFWKALSYSLVDRDSKMGWVMYAYSPAEIIDVREAATGVPNDHL